MRNCVTSLVLSVGRLDALWSRRERERELENERQRERDRERQAELQKEEERLREREERKKSKREAEKVGAVKTLPTCCCYSVLLHNSPFLPVHCLMLHLLDVFACSATNLGQV